MLLKGAALSCQCAVLAVLAVLEREMCVHASAREGVSVSVSVDRRSQC